MVRIDGGRRSSLNLPPLNAQGDDAMCENCSAALKNEQAWINIGMESARLLEAACLALPEGHPHRNPGLSQVAAIRTTPIYSAKRGPKTRKYPLPPVESLHVMPFEGED